MDPAAKLLASIRNAFQQTSHLTGLRAPAPEVEKAILATPRERFVPAEMAAQAYEDRALSIGCGATISQPFVVALMTTLAAVRPTDRVLEIGTGSGYQAAILSKLAAAVFTIEIVPELAAQSAEVLRAEGCGNVTVLQGDGWGGMVEQAPFDAVLITACCAAVPAAPAGQLARGGRMVLPLGGCGDAQELTLVERDGAGELRVRPVLPVRFVPMTGRGR